MRTAAKEAFTASTFTLAMAKLAIRGFVRAHRLIKHRGEVARLTELDDRALKDIGLTRSDVLAALALPLGSDPSDHLSRVAGHKRSIAQGRDGFGATAMRLRRPDAPLNAAQAGRLAA